MPCASVNTAALTAYTTFPAVAGTPVASAAKTSATASSVSNSTVVTFKGAASSSTEFSLFGLFFAGIVAMAL